MRFDTLPDNLRNISFTKSLLLSIIILELFTIGYLASGESFAATSSELTSTKDVENFDCKVNKSLEEKHLNPAKNKLAGGIYSTYPVNHTAFMDPIADYSWTIRTNSHGLREEEVSVDKPSDTFRILVIGDSYTFGWGLNRSQRYTDVLEKRLNSRYSREIEVVNMGRTDAGVRDYYLVLKDKGIKYDPDLVITTLSRPDILSNRKSRIAIEQVMEKYEVDERNQIGRNRTLKEEYKKEKIKMVPRVIDWKGSPFEKYGNGINHLTQKNDVPAVFFLFTHKQSNKGKRFVQSAKGWGASCGAEVVLPPEEYYEKPFEEHTLPQDLHFNPEYNRHMADKLYQYINKEGYLE